MQPLVLNAEPEPPDVQGGEAAHCARHEGHAVVGADRTGEAVLAERALEDRAGPDARHRREPVAREQEPGVLIGESERIAIDAVARAELALEVGSPQIVGQRGERIDHTRVGRHSAAPARHKEPGALQDRARHAHRRPVVDPRMALAEPGQQQLRSPVGMPLPRGDNEVRDPVGRLKRARVRCATPRGEAEAAVLGDARDPLVSCLAANPVAGAQLLHREASPPRVGGGRHARAQLDRIAHSDDPRW
jgi:hypothetical protein